VPSSETAVYVIGGCCPGQMVTYCSAGLAGCLAECGNGRGDSVARRAVGTTLGRRRRWRDRGGGMGGGGGRMESSEWGATETRPRGIPKGPSITTIFYLLLARPQL